VFEGRPPERSLRALNVNKIVNKIGFTRMLGPLFLLEWKYASRRSRHFRFRAIYSAVVALEFTVFLLGWFWRYLESAALHNIPPQSVAELATTYLWLFSIQHCLLLLLVTPALAAGSVSDEKARGTFTVLLTTPLTAGEIVVGKCLGQAAQVLVLSLPAFPLIAFLQALCGVSPVAALAWIIDSVIVAMLLAALSLIACVWARNTTTAVLTVYAVLLAVIAGGWLLGFGDITQGLMLIDPMSDGHYGWSRPITVMAALTAICLLLAAWRLRPACAAEGAPHSPARLWPWLDRPPVSNAPVRWKERYVGELGLLTFARKIPRWASVGVALGLGLLAATFVPGDDMLFLLHGVAMIGSVGLLVAVRSSGAICRERERQTWEGLLLTPLEPYDLIRGKLWGIVDSVTPYLVAYLLVGTLAWSISNGPRAALITALCWLACWPFLYFQAANGLYHSAQATSSWQAMVRALASGMWALIFQAAFGLLVAVICAGAYFMAWSLFMPADPVGAALAGTVIGVAGVVVILVPICMQLFASAEALLQKAEDHVARRDRIVQTGMMKH
jgi:ABC-type transport system involved in multi-copper enzyme maturation permease subunit